FQMRILLLLISYLLVRASANCDSQPPADADYVVLAVGANRGPLTTILNEARDEGLIGLVMKSPKDQCDHSCLFTLEHYEAPHKYSSLVVRKELNEFVPLGYEKLVNRSTVYCARAEGGCGATVPVWRHFFLNGSGIYHTYTLEDSIIDGYTKEGAPLCFVWSQAAMDDEEGSGEIEALLTGERPTRDAAVKVCETAFVSKSKMEVLSEYKNNLTGSELDHLYTIKTSKELKGYNKTKDLGLILPSKESSCTCLVTLVQTLDNQTGVFHRIDHKLMREDAELNRIFEKYNVTGEKFYCAAEKGQCGASLPLYKHFDYIHIDSLITTSQTEIPPTSYRYPNEPLCWIWSFSYDPVEPTTKVTTTVKKTTEWDDDWRNTTRTPTTTTVRPTTVTRPANTTVLPTTVRANTTTVSTSTIRPNSTTVITSTRRPTTPSFNSTVRPTTPSPSMALDEIIVRMVRSAIGDASNWRDLVKAKLREISDQI
ncbi:hypothetical protein PFISCL1PPCAC_19594, partial [Pristionchus fissidentatus]